MREAIWPLKHALIYPWKFGRAQTMSEVGEELSRHQFFVLKPREDVLVATSKARPCAVIFVLWRKDEEGGELLLIQTHLGWYSEEQIEFFMRVFERNAGIRVLRRDIFLLEEGIER